jgi:trans-aconitate methyltransferase
MSDRSSAQAWDRSKHLFSGDGPAVMDNKEVAWPVLRAHLSKYLEHSGSSSKVLELGCGAGQLAELLSQDGFEVVGLDLSSEMVSEARSKRADRRVTFRQGTVDDLSSDEIFHAVTSSMVLPFMDNLDECFSGLGEHLVAGGVLAFVVFDPDFVSWHRALGYELFRETDRGVEMVLEGEEGAEERFPLNLYGAEQYEALLAESGFVKLSESCHFFSGDVALGYERELRPVSRFLAMAFRKV